MTKEVYEITPKSKPQWKVRIATHNSWGADARDIEYTIEAGSRRVAINKALRTWCAAEGKGYRGLALNVSCWRA